MFATRVSFYRLKETWYVKNVSRNRERSTNEICFFLFFFFFFFFFWFERRDFFWISSFSVIFLFPAFRHRYRYKKKKKKMFANILSDRREIVSFRIVSFRFLFFFFFFFLSSFICIGRCFFFKYNICFQRKIVLSSLASIRVRVTRLISVDTLIAAYLMSRARLSLQRWRVGASKET